MSFSSTSLAIGLLFSVFGRLLVRCGLHGSFEGFPQDLLLKELVVDVRALSPHRSGRALFLFLGRGAFCSAFPFGTASFSSSFWGLAICFLAANAHTCSSSSIPDSQTAWSRSPSDSGIFLHFLQIFRYMSGVTAAVRTRLTDCPVCWTWEFNLLQSVR